MMMLNMELIFYQMIIFRILTVINILKPTGMNQNQLLTSTMHQSPISKVKMMLMKITKTIRCCAQTGTVRDADAAGNGIVCSLI